MCDREKRKPLFFIAHSLGGLIVKEVMYSTMQIGVTPLTFRRP